MADNNNSKEKEKFIVKKSKSLKGEVIISGSKNAVLPIIAGCLLTKETVCIRNVPVLTDVFNMLKILESLGAKTSFDVEKKLVKVNCSDIDSKKLDYELINKIRASILVAGSLLARCNYVKIPLPGGCEIGARPVDLHLKGFKTLGVKIKEEHGFVVGKCKEIIGTKIYLDFPSVGATENIILASVLGVGETIIENCAVEPEIIDLAKFLNKMGAKIKHAGSNTIVIEGVKELGSVTHTVIPDRIEAGTFMVAAAITRGDVTIKNIIIDHLKPLIAKLQEMNIEIEEFENSIRVNCNKSTVIKPVDIKTMPYPGFPTDMQSQFMTLLAATKGTSIVTETVFENRFMHAPELIRMGANIKIEGRSAVIEGVDCFTGASVRSTDLRGGASLILVGLIAKGETEITDIHHIERGYYNIQDKFKKLGANIEKV